MYDVGVDYDDLDASPVSQVSSCLGRIYDIAGACTERNMCQLNSISRHSYQGRRRKRTSSSQRDDGRQLSSQTTTLTNLTNSAVHIESSQCNDLRKHLPLNKADALSVYNITKDQNLSSVDITEDLDVFTNNDHPIIDYGLDGFDIPEDLDLQNPDLSLFDDLLS